MTEQISNIVLTIAGALASKDLLGKLFGPTMEYMGDGTLGLVKKSKDNLQRIISIAIEKLKEQLDKPGQVNPRVLKAICDEGRFIEDNFCAEYFGGLLSSARSSDGHDDSAISFLSVIKSMSAKQIRLHFIVYALLSKHRFDPKIADLRDSWQSIELQIPLAELLQSMEIRGVDAESDLLLALTGLSDLNLIAQRSSAGIARRKSGVNRLEAEVVIVHPNERGSRLFLRALGSRGVSPELISSINVDLCLSDSNKYAIELPEDARISIKRDLEPFAKLEKQFNERFSEVESSISDLETNLDELNDD
jgi:hypothetical protein